MRTTTKNGTNNQARNKENDTGNEDEINLGFPLNDVKNQPADARDNAYYRADPK